jgi:flagellar biosynthesis/type III secretory pathway chaperone
MDDPQGTAAPASVPDLLTFLNTSRETASRLTDLLDREYEALVTWNTDTVIATAAAKQTLLAELEAGYAGLERRLAQQDLQLGLGSVASVIEAAGTQSPALARAWNDFRAALQRLRQANRANCELVGSATRQTHQLLTLLQGETSTPLYGPGTRPAAPIPARIRDEI